MWIPAWFLAGLVWSFPRWLLFLRKAKAEYVAELKNFADTKNQVPDTAQWSTELRYKWDNEWELQNLERKYHFEFDCATGKLKPPSFDQNMDRLTSWVLLWPWSVFWTMFRDGIMRLIEEVVRFLGRAYQKLSQSVFKDF